MKAKTICSAQTVQRIRLSKNNNGVYYLRTREVSDYLLIKQPYEFTKKVSEWAGEIPLCGDSTKPMRSKGDNSRTIFLSIDAIFGFLCRTDRLGMKIDEKRKSKLIDKLAKYID